MKNYALLLITALLAGCATNRIPLVADMNTYVDSLQFRAQKSEMTHSEYGLKRLNEEPLLTVHKDCIKTSYSGSSVNLAGIEVSDPFLLDEMRKDLTTFTFMRSLGLRLDRSSDPVKANHYAVMRDPKYIDAMNSLDVPDKKVRECLKENGWTFSAIDKFKNK